MTIAIVCFLHFGLDIQVQKNVVISGIMVFGIKVTSSVVDLVSWSYMMEIFPSDLRGIASGIVFFVANIICISAPQ